MPLQRNMEYISSSKTITVKHSFKQSEDQKLFDVLTNAEVLLEKQKSSSFILGDRALFGVMPDWNPAEIIGTKPTTLAASLYCDLILNEIWAKQRAEYGYRDVRPHSLLTIFAGHPYIDIRASFNSFIPKKLAKKTAKKLVNFCLEWLENHPELHDKVEFDVIPTCCDLDFFVGKVVFFQAVFFSNNEIFEIKESLLKITNNALSRSKEDLINIEKLEKRFNEIERTEIAPLEKAFILLEDAKLYGTLPFLTLQEVLLLQ